MIRRIGSGAAAVFITLGLFWIMHALIILNAQYQKTDFRTINIDFVRVKEDTAAKTKDRELPEKTQQKTPPPTPQITSSAARPDLGNIGGAVIGIPTSDITSGPKLGAALSDMDAVPLVRIAPEYPARAAQRNQKGWVLLSFTVTTSGSTKDVTVVDSEPPRVFDRAATRAVEKFKYRPKVVDGKPVEQYGVQIVITFDGVVEEG